MKFAANPNKDRSVLRQQAGQQQIHSGEGSDSAWQALQQAIRTKPRAGFLPTRSQLEVHVASAKKRV